MEDDEDGLGTPNSAMEDIVEHAKEVLLKGKVKERVAFIKDRLLPADLEPAQVGDILKLLVATVPRYADTPSREAVLAVLRKLLLASASPSTNGESSATTSTGKMTASLLRWIESEASKTASPTAVVAPTTRHVLLSWALTLLAVLSEQGQEATKQLVGSIGALLDGLVDEEKNHRATARHAAVVLARRTVRNNHTTIPRLITLLTETKTEPSWRNAVFLGLVLDVSLRLKNAAKKDGERYIQEATASVGAFWSEKILPAKPAPPTRVLTALNDFFAATANDSLVSSLLPSMEKLSLRSPEVSLSTIASFFVAAPPAASGVARAKLAPQALAGTKSANPAARAGAVALFQALKLEDKDVKEVLALLKGGKTSSADHRGTLFLLLSSSVAADENTSPEIVKAALGLLAKETNEAAIQALMAAVEAHLPAALAVPGFSLEAAQTSALVARLADPKAGIKRAVAASVGGVFYSLPEKAEEAGKKLAKDLLPAWEAALKVIAGNPVNAPAGPLDGYIALALLRGRYASWGLKPVGNPVLDAALTAGVKPSFLLWERVYKKASTGVEELWLLRALRSIWGDEGERAKLRSGKDAAGLAVAVAQPILHLLVNTRSVGTREEAVKLVEVMNASDPKLANELLDRGLRAWLAKTEEGKAAAAATVAGEDDKAAPVDRTHKVLPVLTALAKFGEGVSQEQKEHSLVNLLVLAHHPALVGEDAGLWIDMLRTAGLSPEGIIESRLDDLLAKITDDASPIPTNGALAQAAYRAVTTLALILPELVVPRVHALLQSDLDPDALKFIGTLEFGVWRTPEGETFVDVLSSKKSATPTVDKKAKDRDIQLWEAELRESLARKKPAVTSLSKEDKKLFDAQLAKEAVIREQVGTLLGKAKRGFALVLALTRARTPKVSEYLARLIEAVLRVIRTEAAVLISEEAFSTFLGVGRICSDNLGEFKTALGVSVLRGMDAQVVPESWLSEPLGSLVTRVLHRIRFFAEKQPFDAATYAYAAPLIGRTVAKGGLGIDKDDPEGMLEQVTLAVDFMGFHVRLGDDVAFPRLSMIRSLLASLLAYPSLARPATAALSDLCEAMSATATPEEIETLLEGGITEEASVRFAALQGLQHLDVSELGFLPKLWILCHDLDERNRELALETWQLNGCEVPAHFHGSLIPFLAHPAAAVRQATALAIASGLDSHPEDVTEVLAAVEADYKTQAEEIVPQYDQFGMIIEASLNVEDPWRTRVAHALTFKEMSPLFDSANVDALFNLLVEGHALGDRSQSVRSAMLDAAVEVIDIHGKEHLQPLIALFEGFLGRPVAAGNEMLDHITESLVILYGRLARHLHPSDPKVSVVIERLMGALKTPSEVVQSAVCDCLPPLVGHVPDKIPKLVDQLVTMLFKGDKYAERRGAAYGLAGVIEGRGILAMQEFDILHRLQDNAEDKKSYQARQGAVFAFEVLATTLGRLFEPYIVELLPSLLTCFGDSSTDVREATQDAAKAIMSKLSGHGVKLILPTLLAGLDDKQWRAKKGAIELMGAMAYLAPRQLSKSLPTIIPQLTEVLTDTHKQVREAANTSLKRFGEVVTNPEIQAMQTILLDALVDPSRKTAKALDTLLAATFAHFIDTSSLALVVPILDRGLRERSAETKRKASAIVGNLATLTESRDLIPYLSQLVPLVRSVLIDPVPEARSTAAKSLGSLVERLGENSFPDLVDSLLAVLKSPSSGVDQQGAAQGLAEVLAGLGVERLDDLFPVILANTSSPRAYVREGHISLLVFLPVTFGDRFAPYLNRIIPPVLKGLADDSDFVRDASMRAGRMIVTNHSNKAVELLLPELENELFNESWRNRQSAIQLIGELLFRLSGISGKLDDGEDEDEEEDTGMVSENTRKALIDVLGKDRRDRVLSSLYIVRYDAVASVRQGAVHVWKALVQNTPRTIRDMLPILLHLIVRTLASPSYDQKETAARCLGETCRKLGESVFSEVIGNLHKAMLAGDGKQKEGVCLAITELLETSLPSHLESQSTQIISIIRDALVAPEQGVRQAAARAFDAAQQAMGPQSIDETIPTLLDALRTPGEASEAALDALREVMQVRAEKIFPILIPRLITKPISAFNARAIGSLVKVAGSALGKRLTTIVDALYNSFTTETDEDIKASVDEALGDVLSSVVDHETGLGTLQMHMLSLAKAESAARRVAGCMYFAKFCQSNTDADFSDYTADWIRQLVSSFDDRSPDVVEAAWVALDALVKTVDKEDMEQLVVPLRRTIESTGAPGQTVAGFLRPNGLKPIIPILLQGLLAGTAEQREQGAYAFGDLVERTTPEVFKSYCIQTVGPLIRVIGERKEPPVKSAILHTLTILLTRVPQFVKPFFPQLQRTFVKSLSDTSSSSVRNRAAAALKELMLHQPRIDPLITELINLVAAEDGDIRDSILLGLGNAVASGGKNMSESSRSAVVDVVSEAFKESNRETTNIRVAALLAAVAIHSIDAVAPLLSEIVLSEVQPTVLTSHCLLQLLTLAPEQLYELDSATPAKVIAKVAASVATDQAPAVARPAREARALLKETQPWKGEEGVQKL